MEFMTYSSNVRKGLQRQLKNSKKGHVKIIIDINYECEDFKVEPKGQRQFNNQELRKSLRDLNNKMRVMNSKRNLRLAKSEVIQLKRELQEANNNYNIFKNTMLYLTKANMRYIEYMEDKIDKLKKNFISAIEKLQEAVQERSEALNIAK